MVMGFLFGCGGAHARDLFRGVNKTEFSWEILTQNENRPYIHVHVRKRKRDRTKMRPETGPALALRCSSIRSSAQNLFEEGSKLARRQEVQWFVSRRCLSSIRTNISKDIHGKARTSAGALHTRVSDNKLLTNKSRSSRRALKKMGNKVSLEDELVNLRITSKQMQRSAKKCEKNEKAAIEKLKKVRLGWLWFMEHRFPIIFR